ncbi:sensor histidine kinase [Pseudomonas otitidis]|uniref:sensor histidine kinase n=1 Tax=Metapseudomonas otitidis TaxID=319939 RepID=UPI002E7AE9DF|nr:sensor histidine kinase [Pseudomonas otitidis]MEE1895669.1 sensor histidine kinase [Pseudomonas otitidis]
MQPHQFKPRARLIRTIGDKLVSGPVAAIVELVKNAHDADSEVSRIKFRPGSHSKPSLIEISDLGHGMTYETVINSWMEPATEHKVKNTFTPSGTRRLLGSKGIGRFAASRLGDQMTLTTSAIRLDLSKIEITTIKIDWSKFDGERYLDEIPIQIRKSYQSLKYPTGTTIRIRSLRDNWVSNEILDLYRELRRLISPIQIKSLDQEKSPLPFSIYLDVSQLNEKIPLALGSEAKEKEIKIEPAPILDSADYEVTGKFSAAGKFSGEIKFNAVGEPYSEKIEEIFPLNTSDGVQECGELEVRLLIFDRETESIEALIARAGLQGYGKRAARQILDEMTGVGIYRDGFRIRPYGDKDQDWLELSRRRVDNPSIRIGPNQIAGYISISEEADSGLIERSSREGLEANGSYKRLQSLITGLLGSAVEPMRRRVREGTGKGKRQPRHERIIEAAEFTWKERVLAEVPLAKKDLARKIIEDAQEDLKRRIADQIEHERILEARATLGKIIAEVLHELRNPLKSISGLLKHIKFDWKKITSLSEDHSILKDEYLNRTEENIKQSQRMEKLLRQLDPLATKRSGPPTSQDAYMHIISSIEVMRIKANECGVKIELEGEKGHLYKGYGDEIQTSLINLIDNSIFWLTKSGNQDPTIRVSLYKENNTLTIRVEDNGPGIKESYSESIFDAGFTTKVSDGQGLGLAISREALARVGGTLELASFVGGCTFEIKLKEAQNG